MVLNQLGICMKNKVNLNIYLTPCTIINSRKIDYRPECEYRTTHCQKKKKNRRIALYPLGRQKSQDGYKKHQQLKNTLIY